MNIKDILPIIVLYNQSIESSITLQSLNSIFEYQQYKVVVYIYDNSPVKQYDDNNFKWGNLNVIYVSNTNNIGVSGAFNYGATFAKNNNIDWILLLDQDTMIPSNFFEKTFIAINGNPECHLFVPTLKLSNGVNFSPCLNKHKRGYPLKSPILGKNNLEKYAAVNSGMIIKLTSFFRAGGYNPDVKLDFADFQFLERVKRHDPLFYVTDAVCIQAFSGNEPSVTKQKNRFTIYLKDASNCYKPYLRDKIEFFYTVTRHTFGLALKLQSLSFLLLYFKLYLFKKQ